MKGERGNDHSEVYSLSHSVDGGAISRRLMNLGLGGSGFPQAAVCGKSLVLRRSR